MKLTHRLKIDCLRAVDISTLILFHTPTVILDNQLLKGDFETELFK